MTRTRRSGRRIAIAGLLLLPSLALAEVSVQLDGHGRFKRLWYLTNAHGRPVVWEQVRSRLQPQDVLNPLGDNLGDGAPAIQLSPVNGYPWVVWPKNIGNIKQLAIANWAGRAWTGPDLLFPGQPLVYDDLDPALAIDTGGTPYVVWMRAEQTSKIYFSTRIQGRWTPGVLLSDPAVNSRKPSIALDGSRVVVTYGTDAGPVTRNYETSILVNSAASLMDNPIPPLNAPPPTTAPPGSDPGPGDQMIRHN